MRSEAEATLKKILTQHRSAATHGEISQFFLCSSRYIFTFMIFIKTAKMCSVTDDDGDGDCSDSDNEDEETFHFSISARFFSCCLLHISESQWFCCLVSLQHRIIIPKKSCFVYNINFPRKCCRLFDRPEWEELCVSCSAMLRNEASENWNKIWAEL